MTDNPFSRVEFDSIYSRVPRLTVEVIARAAGGIILTERSIDPCKGMWHIPGGTVRMGEPLVDAVVRVAAGELGVRVLPGDLLGYIEYPEMFANGYSGWPVGMVFDTEIIDGRPRGSEQGENIDIFTEVPPNTVTEQARFLNAHIF